MKGWQKDSSLHFAHSFGFEHKAKWFRSAKSEEVLVRALQQVEQEKESLVLLGAGSNVLFVSDVEAAVLHIGLSEVELLSETTDSVLVRASAGVDWTCFVEDCVSRGWTGLENLSSIPGSVGVAPVQNIGAYGAEVSSCIESVHVREINTRKKRVLSPAACAFGYRDSIFKQRPDQYVVTGVVFRLSKKFSPVLTYKGLEDLQGRPQLSAQEVAQRVSALRNAKLPHPKEVGNGGSFFKNPIVKREDYERLRRRYPEMVGNPVSGRQVKLSAAWLIERCGWKGFRRGAVGVDPKHALILVHYGGGKGEDLWTLAGEIQSSVEKTFGLHLVPEVERIGNQKASSVSSY